MFRFRYSVIRSESQCVSMTLSSGLGMVQKYTIFTTETIYKKRKYDISNNHPYLFFTPMRKYRDIG